jgi:hypothetical protein
VAILEKQLAKDARMAGIFPVIQPNSAALCNGFFTPSQMRFLFPGKLTRSVAEKRAKLANKLIDAHSVTGPGALAAQRKAAAAIPLASLPAGDSNLGVLHYDLLLPPVQGNTSLIVDHMTVQPSCETYCKEGVDAAFTKVKKVKQTKYSSLQQIHSRLHADGYAEFKPRFLLPCITTDGLMDPDMAEMIKFTATNML